MARTRGKRWRNDAQSVPADPVSLDEAVQRLQGFAKTKFDQTVELVLHLGIDPKQADQLLRGSLSLPHGIGTTKRVIAFCEGGDVELAKAAGAAEAGSDELIKKVQDGWMDFDVAVATPQVMRSVSRLGRLLGPQGKMPSPKSGTVTPEVAKAVKEFQAGKIEYRNDQYGNIHALVGKRSFAETDLVENIESLIEHVRSVRPTAVKGIYMAKAVLSTTMGPGLKLAV